MKYCKGSVRNQQGLEKINTNTSQDLNYVRRASKLGDGDVLSKSAIGIMTQNHANGRSIQLRLRGEHNTVEQTEKLCGKGAIMKVRGKTSDEGK